MRLLVRFFPGKSPKSGLHSGIAVALAIAITMVFSASAHAVEHAGFNTLEYVDSELIIKHNLAEVSSSIFNKAKNELNDTGSGSCVGTTYRFDLQGQLVSTHLNRLNGYWQSLYENGRLVDYAFVNSDTGEVQKQSEKLDPNKFKKQLQMMRKVLEQTMSNKLAIAGNHKRYFYDPCFNLDGLYQMELVESGPYGPKYAKAYLIKKGKNPQSPEILYIYFDYKQQQVADNSAAIPAP
ncbi:MAG: hypothetical protein OEZ68_02710 [Gammaproteobacteria bacterium]|nr:hypothetical protein [Gammaproteobacteria bacterium]MDH5799692.1 hypothetical protein [Gammaproteobacteria bacterium]